MNYEEKIHQLEKELADLRQRHIALTNSFNSLSTAFRKEMESTTRAFHNASDIDIEIINYLMPVVHKVFPGIDEEKRKVREFLEKATKQAGKYKGADS